VNSRRRQAAAEGGDADQGRVIRCPHCRAVLERFAS
jgi:hypothetical protein